MVGTSEGGGKETGGRDRVHVGRRDRGEEKRT